MNTMTVRFAALAAFVLSNLTALPAMADNSIAPPALTIRSTTPADNSTAPPAPADNSAERLGCFYTYQWVCNAWGYCQYQYQWVCQ